MVLSVGLNRGDISEHLTVIEKPRKLETIAFLAQVDDSESAVTADEATEGGSCSLLI